MLPTQPLTQHDDDSAQGAAVDGPYRTAVYRHSTASGGWRHSAITLLQVCCHCLCL